MNHQEIGARLTGFSTPIFGLSWEPPTADREVARGVIAFVEDRRILYDPTEAEVIDWCVASANEIRQWMTDVLISGRIGVDLAGHIRGIRSAATRFVGDTGPITGDPHLGQWTGRMGFTDWRFLQAVGEFRATAGMHIAAIAAAYGVDIDGPLADALPLDPES